MNAVVIEDEEHLRISIKDLLELFCPQVTLCGMAENVKKGIELIRSSEPQLIFLDIRLPDGSGFDLLKKLEASAVSHPPFQVIFTTAFDEFALKAIKVNALDYLLKPIDPDELVEVVKKAQSRLHLNPLPEDSDTFTDDKNIERRQKNKISITTSDQVHVVNIDEIMRCESQDNYTLFHIVNEKPVLVSKTLKEFDQILSPHNFERIHRSHLINMDFLKSFVKADGGYVIMKDGFQIPVAIRKKESLLRRLRSYL